MATPADPLRNELLAALTPDDWQRLQPLLEWTDMPLGQVMYESGRTISQVYFPVTSIVSPPRTARSTSELWLRSSRWLIVRTLTSSDRSVAIVATTDPPGGLSR